MFSGFFLNAASTPVYLVWFEWLSPMKYAFTALAVNEFEGLELHCTDAQVRTVLDRESGTAIAICPIPDGDTYLQSLNLQEQDWLTVGNCNLIMVLYMVIFTVLAYGGLVLTSHRAISKARAKMPAKGTDAVSVA